MKNFMWVAGILWLFSCGDDDTSPSSPDVEENVSLSPPGWIQGTWADEFDIFTCEFESDDSRIVTSFGNVESMVDLLSGPSISSWDETIGETSNGNLGYSVEYVQGASNTEYRFIQSNSTSVVLSLIIDGTSTPVTLIKQ